MLNMDRKSGTSRSSTDYYKSGKTGLCHYPSTVTAKNIPRKNMIKSKRAVR